MASVTRGALEDWSLVMYHELGIDVSGTERSRDLTFFNRARESSYHLIARLLSVSTLSTP